MEYLKPVDFQNKKRVDIELYNMDMRRVFVKDPKEKTVEDRENREKKNDNDRHEKEMCEKFPEDEISIHKSSSGSFVIPPKKLKEHTPFLQKISELSCIKPEMKKFISSDYYDFQPQTNEDLVIDTFFIYKLMNYISGAAIKGSSSLIDIVNYFIYLGYYYHFIRFNNINSSIKKTCNVKMKKNININFLDLSINNPSLKPMFYKEKILSFNSL